jgi:hypothetical protein
VSDGHSLVKATFDKAATIAFERKEQRKFRKQTIGGIVKILTYSLQISVGHGAAISICFQIHDFELQGDAGSGKFGQPVDVRNDRELQKLVEEIEKVPPPPQLDDEDTPSPIRSQNGDEYSPFSLKFSTQMPGIHTNAALPPNRPIARTATTSTDGRCPPNNAKLLNLLGLPPKLPKDDLVSDTAVTQQSPERFQETDLGHSDKETPQATVCQPELQSGLDTIKHVCEPSSGTGHHDDCLPLNSELKCTTPKAKDKVEPGLSSRDDHKAELAPAEAVDPLGAFQWNSVRRIPRKHTRIPKNQQTVLEHLGAWMRSNDLSTAQSLVPPVILRAADQFASRSSKSSDVQGTISSHMVHHHGERQDPRVEDPADCEVSDQAEQGILRCGTSPSGQSGKTKMSQETLRLAELEASPNSYESDEPIPWTPSPTREVACAQEMIISSSPSPVLEVTCAQETLSIQPNIPTTQEYAIRQDRESFMRDGGTESGEHQEENDEEDVLEIEVPYAVNDYIGDKESIAMVDEPSTLTDNERSSSVQVNRTPQIDKQGHRVANGVNPQEWDTDSSDLVIPGTFENQHSHSSLPHTRSIPSKDNDRIMELVRAVSHEHLELSAEKHKLIHQQERTNSVELDLSSSYASTSNPTSPAILQLHEGLEAPISKAKRPSLSDTSAAMSTRDIKSTKSAGKRRCNVDFDFSQTSENPIDLKALTRDIRKDFIDGRFGIARSTRARSSSTEPFVQGSCSLNKQNHQEPDNRPPQEGIIEHRNLRTTVDSDSARTCDPLNSVIHAFESSPDLTSSSRMEVKSLLDVEQAPDSIYEQFRAVYPSYEGSPRSFIRAAVYIEWLRSSKRTVPRFLYDEYLRTFASKEYSDHITEAEARKEKPLALVAYYNEYVYDPIYNERFIGPENLQEVFALDPELADNTMSFLRSKGLEMSDNDASLHLAPDAMVKDHIDLETSSQLMERVNVSMSPFAPPQEHTTQAGRLATVITRSHYQQTVSKVGEEADSLSQDILVQATRPPFFETPSQLPAQLEKLGSHEVIQPALSSPPLASDVSHSALVSSTRKSRHHLPWVTPMNGRKAIPVRSVPERMPISPLIGEVDDLRLSLKAPSLSWSIRSHERPKMQGGISGLRSSEMYNARRRISMPSASITGGGRVESWHELPGEKPSPLTNEARKRAIPLTEEDLEFQSLAKQYVPKRRRLSDTSRIGSQSIGKLTPQAYTRSSLSMTEPDTYA